MKDEDVTAYLVSKQGYEEIGISSDSAHGLLARAWAMKHPCVRCYVDLEDDPTFVLPDLRMQLPLTDKMIQQAKLFDALGGSEHRAITRHEFTQAWQTFEEKEISDEKM